MLALELLSSVLCFARDWLSAAAAATPFSWDDCGGGEEALEGLAETNSAPTKGVLSK